MGRVTTTNTAYWAAGKLVLIGEDTDETRARRWRAREVIEKYPYELRLDGVVFNKNMEVLLLPDRVGCTCQDLKHRLLPCKHVFAAASLLGDESALLDTKPTAISTGRRSADEPHKPRVHLRPQDIQVGEYFLLSDFLFSDTALKHGLPNWLEINSKFGKEVIDCMGQLCEKLLDPLCEEFGRISITRGYLGQDVYKFLYRNDPNWPKGALAHGFQDVGGADVVVHSWTAEALQLAFYIQQSPKYTFDFIRIYPMSPVLCVGVGRFKNRRTIQEWQNNFAGQIIHRI